eukprot:COSAG02_NODE_6089_length_3811_cov_79.446803_3_plen_370_part_00
MKRESIKLMVLALLTVAGPALLLMHMHQNDQRATASVAHIESMAQHTLLPNSSVDHRDAVAELPLGTRAMCGTVRNPCVPTTARVRIPIPSAASGFNDEVLKTSVLTHGDVSPLLQLKQKLDRGQPVDVAVFGGSISRGHQLEMDAPEGTPETVLRDEYTWGGQLVAWLNAEFPVKLAGKRHTLRNLAKPASGSKYAAEHLEQLLQPDPNARLPPPDLVLCEFAVNDAGGCSQKNQPSCLRKPNRELARCKCRPHAVYTEQLVRALIRNANTAVIYLEFSTGFTQGSVRRYDQTVAQHTRVCHHYGVPQWSLRKAMLLRDNHTTSATASVSLAAQQYWCVNAPLCHWYVHPTHSNSRMQSFVADHSRRH